MASFIIAKEPNEHGLAKNQEQLFLLLLARPLIYHSADFWLAGEVSHWYLLC